MLFLKNKLLLIPIQFIAHHSTHSHRHTKLLQTTLGATFYFWRQRKKKRTTKKNYTHRTIVKWSKIEDSFFRSSFDCAHSNILFLFTLSIFCSLRLLFCCSRFSFASLCTSLRATSCIWTYDCGFLLFSIFFLYELFNVCPSDYVCTVYTAQCTFVYVDWDEWMILFIIFSAHFIAKAKQVVRTTGR